MNWRVPNANGNPTAWRFEEQAGAFACVGCGSRWAYYRNFMFIRNINAADIDDTGCPSACPGDRGVVNSNVLRKPVK
jgi:hypothetical protein